MLILGLLGSVITMLVHPTGANILPDNPNAMHMLQVNVFAHSLAIACIPLTFIGLLGFSRTLGLDRLLVQSALVSYGFGGIAGMAAAVYSGFGGTGLARLMTKTNDEPTRQMLEAMFRYNGIMNQGFAKVMFVATSVSIICWSASILKSNKLGKAIGVFGSLIGVLSLALFAAGHLHLDVHGFGAFIFAISVWFLMVAIWLFKSDKDILDN